MPTHGGQSGSKPPAGAADPAALVGLEIGDFEIIREIGRGGMGTVFQARQKSLNRIIALKVLSSGLGLTPSAVLRFQREAEAAAKLHHANIVPIYAQGESQGVYYYAMEFIRGESIHDLVSRARYAARSSSAATAEVEPLPPEADPAATVPMTVPPQVSPSDAGDLAASDPGWSRGASRTPQQFERIAGLIAAVADALDYAHQQGVIHRDVKPHNLILGEDGRMYILDFGLARVLEQPGVTTTGEFVGSPLYMSPEQITGGRRKVDKRTDTYSLGATLYEWLTLSPPFPGETREQVISLIITSEVPAPQSLNTHIPMDLETIVLKALEKTPERRYQSAAEMRDDLRRFAAHEAIRAKRAGMVSHLQKFVRRNKVASLATAGLLVAMTLSAALVYQSRSSRGREKEIAAIVETKEELQQKTAELHEAVKAKEEAVKDKEEENEFLRAMLRGEEAAQQLQRMDPAAAQVIQAVVAGGGPKTDPLAQRLSRMFIERQRRQEAGHHETRLGPGEGAAYELYLQALGAEDAGQALTQVNECLRLAPGHVRAEMLAAALACANQDYALMAAHAGLVVLQQPDTSGGYLLRGTAKLLSGDWEASLADFSRAGEHGDETALALALRGVAHRHGADPAQALRDFDEALGSVPDNLVALLERGRTHADLRNYEAAIADVSRAIQLEPSNAEAYVLRGDWYYGLERYAESSADYYSAMTLEPGSVWIVAKLWQATAKRKGQEDDQAGPAGAKAANTPSEPTAPTTAPGLPPGVRRDDQRLEWWRRLAPWKEPDSPERRGTILSFPSRARM